LHVVLLNLISVAKQDYCAMQRSTWQAIDATRLLSAQIIHGLMRQCQPLRERCAG
jgi:hypothetical protein